MRTKARDFAKPGYAGFQFTYAEQAVSLSGLPLEAIRETYRKLVANAKAGNTKAEAYLPLVVQVGLGLALAEEVEQAMHDHADAEGEAWAEGAWLRAAENTYYPCYCGRGQGGICC